MKIKRNKPTIVITETEKAVLDRFAEMICTELEDDTNVLGEILGDIYQVNPYAICHEVERPSCFVEVVKE